MLYKGLAAGTAAACCVALFWIMGVLLVTRQTDLVLLLMSLVAAVAVVLAFYARKKGWRWLFFLALIVLVLAAGLGLMALTDLLEPETASTSEYAVLSAGPLFQSICIRSL